VYASSTSALATGSALTFDGSKLVGSGQANFGGVLQITGEGVPASGAGLELSGSASGTGITSFNRSLGTFLSQGSNALQYTFLTSGTEALRLTSSSLHTASGINVGFGLSNPTAKLEVASDGSATNTVYLTDTRAYSATPKSVVGFNFKYNTAGTYTTGSLIQGGKENASDNDYASELSFWTRVNGGDLTKRMELNSSGNLGLGVTPSAWATFKALELPGGAIAGISANQFDVVQNAYYDTSFKYKSTGGATLYQQSGSVHAWATAASGTAGDAITFTQAMTLDASGQLLVGKTSGGTGTAGVELIPSGGVFATRASNLVLLVNRLTDDGTLVSLRQDSTEEGTISVSGTTVSYNGGHLSRYAQTTTAKDDSIVKGTVLSNLDEMSVYTKDGQPVANEQLNKVKVSDTEGDANVAGVFVNWSHDEDHNVDEINMAMTGDMNIRIAQGTTVVRGDLLMSAGDGTAKPQGDDIVRSKTVAKVTSNYITCTYADGSYCVPCVLMAC
jgi:hypothetical protein